MTTDIVYIVTSGEYSEYGINGVYLDRDAAYAAISGSMRHRVEEWPVGGGKRGDGRTPWYISSDNGNTSANEAFSVDSDTSYRRSTSAWGTSESMRAFVWANDNQHALKIGTELLMRCRALWDMGMTIDGWLTDESQRMVDELRVSEAEHDTH